MKKINIIIIMLSFSFMIYSVICYALNSEQAVFEETVVNLIFHSTAVLINSILLIVNTIYDNKNNKEDIDCECKYREEKIV